MALVPTRPIRVARPASRVAAARRVLMVCALAVAPGVAYAQTPFERQPVTSTAWVQPFPAFRIFGNLYYVGGYDLASYLITTPEGHILVNTGVYDSAASIRDSVETLGFDFGDIEILLTTQAHWDHAADLAAIKRSTGAALFAHEADVASLEDGGASDFRFPDGRPAVFEPVVVDRRLVDGDTIELGDVVVTLHHHPGHTKGSSSFSFKAGDASDRRSVLIVNMGTINPGVELLDMRAYPGIAHDYARTFERQAAMSPDIWVSSHAGHFDLHDKFEPGDAYDPDRFANRDAYFNKIRGFEQVFRTQLEEARTRRR